MLCRRDSSLTLKYSAMHLVGLICKDAVQYPLVMLHDALNQGLGIIHKSGPGR